MKTLDTTNSPIETHFEQVHSIIDLHRSRALRVVNNESLLIAWNVGQYVAEKLKENQWGSKVVTQLSEYLRTKDPSLKGYSRRNIYNMVSFFETYSSPQFMQLLETFNSQNEFVQTETVQIENIDNQTVVIVQTNSAQLDQSKLMARFLLEINWSMHVEIMNNCKHIEQNFFYIIYAQKERLNYRELQRAIKTNTFIHILKEENNQSKGMETAYPQSNYLFKDVAYLDFLGLPQKHSEKRLQNDILANMKNFVLELGKDFLFIGQEYPRQAQLPTKQH